MALMTTINQDTCGDAWNNPQNVDRISITHDGESVTYLHDGIGWYRFGGYTTLSDSCIDVTPETVVAELIRAIALSMEEPVELWLS